MLEAVNESRADCFGWAVEEVFEQGESLIRVRPDGCRHHHRNKRNLVGKSKVDVICEFGQSGAERGINED